MDVVKNALCGFKRVRASAANRIRDCSVWLLASFACMDARGAKPPRVELCLERLFSELGDVESTAVGCWVEGECFGR